MKRAIAIPVLLLLAACASTEPQATPAPQPVVQAPLDPVGTYEFSTVVDGQTVTGSFVVTGSPGAYTGKIVTNMFPEFQITSATVEGKVINLKALMPDGEVAIRLLMDGMNFTGTWAVGGDAGDFTGKKLPK